MGSASLLNLSLRRVLCTETHLFSLFLVFTVSSIASRLRQRYELENETREPIRAKTRNSADKHGKAFVNQL